MNGKNIKGITLISLVITIIVLIILASVAIYLSLGSNGIFVRGKQAKEVTNKQEATEKINLKITTVQINTYAEKQVMPTLQELADSLCDDNEIQYVTTKSKVSAIDKISVGKATSIFTKLNRYPYEFEINSSLQLASIDGINIANNNGTVTLTNQQYEDIITRLTNLENNSIKFVDYSNKLATISTQGATYTANQNCALVAYMTSNGAAAEIMVDGISIGSINGDNKSNVRGTQMLYVKKGSTVTTRANYGDYNISIYALLEE